MLQTVSHCAAAGYACHNCIQNDPGQSGGGFEPTTSTTPRKATRVPTDGNQTSYDDKREALHQLLHQLAEIAHAEDGIESLAEWLRGRLEPKQRRRLARLLEGG